MKSQIGYWGCVLQLRGPLPYCRCVRSNSSHRSPLVPERSIARDEAMEADNNATLFTWGHPITAQRGPLINMLKLVVSASNNSLLYRNKKSVHAACLEWLWGQTQAGHLNSIIAFPPRKERVWLGIPVPVYMTTLKGNTFWISQTCCYLNYLMNLHHHFKVQNICSKSK